MAFELHNKKNKGVIGALLKRVYGSLAENLIELLKKPPSRLYARVNTIKSTRSEVLEALRKDGIEAYADENIPDAVYFEVKGPYDVECPGEKRIVVDVRTAVSLMLGADLYRPGILKAPKFDRSEYLLAVTSRGTVVSCIKTVVSSETMQSLTRGVVGVNVSSPYKAPKLAESKAYLKGLIYPQSAPSIITSHVLKPKTGMLIVDMNAAPGGKTGHIVQLVGGKALIVAFDRSEKKVSVLQNTLSKLGLNISVLAVPADSRFAHIDFALASKADRVLIDPPCSNLGVRPLLDYDRSLNDVLSLSNYQKHFLKAARSILKKGGILVYSTCTLTLDENEENVVYAVEELGFSPYEPPEQIPYAEKVSYKGIVGYRFSPLKNDMPGYFIAVLTL